MLDVHDLHVWELVDKLVIASVHVRVRDSDVHHAQSVMARAKAVFHKHGVHSCTLQPEFVPQDGPNTTPCQLNCVEDCAEDWCCKPDDARAHTAPSAEAPI